MTTQGSPPDEPESRPGPLNSPPAPIVPLGGAEPVRAVAAEPLEPYDDEVRFTDGSAKMSVTRWEIKSFDRNSYIEWLAPDESGSDGASPSTLYDASTGLPAVAVEGRNNQLDWDYQMSGGGWGQEVLGST